MATFFRNKVVNNVGSIPVKSLETDGNTRSTIVGISMANLTGSLIYANVLVKDDGSSLGFYLKDVVIPANSSLRALSAGEKLVLAPNNELYFQASRDDAIDVVISYVDIV